MSAKSVTAAKAEAEAARLRLTATLHEVQERLSPKVIARDAWDRVSDRSVEVADDAARFVQARPMVASAALAAAVAFLARKPLGHAVSTLFRRDPKRPAVPDDVTAPVHGANPAKFDKETQS